MDNMLHLNVHFTCFAATVVPKGLVLFRSNAVLLFLRSAPLAQAVGCVFVAVLRNDAEAVEDDWTGRATEPRRSPCALSSVFCCSKTMLASETSIMSVVLAMFIARETASR